MFNQNNEISKAKVNTLIKEIADENIEDIEESMQTKYNKKEMFNALKQVSNDNRELSKQNINGTGENMDATDRELLANSIEKILEDKLKEKFTGLESNLKSIEDSVTQTCVDGKCFTTKLDEFEEKLNSIDDVKTEVAGIKSGVNDEIKGMHDSFSDLSKNVTDSISNIDTNFDDTISKINEKLDGTCEGVDCLNKRFTDQDVQNDTVTCPKDRGGCGETFLVSENTKGDFIVCPNCGIKLKLV